MITTTEEIQYGNICNAETGTVTGRIYSIELLNFEEIIVSGEYAESNGDRIDIIDEPITKEEHATLYAALRGILSGDDDWLDEAKILFYTAMKPKMANRFGINVSILR